MSAPRFEITPKHVIAFFRKEYGMKVSQADARRWLKLWGYTFAQELKEIVAPELAGLFHQATLRDYPNATFTRFYRRVDRALQDAIDTYEDSRGLDWKALISTDRERCKLVSFLMNGGNKRTGMFWQKCAFLPKGTPDRRDDDEYASFRFIVSVAGRKITARIMEETEPTPPGIKIFGVEDSGAGPKPHDDVARRSLATTRLQ